MQLHTHLRAYVDAVLADDNADAEALAHAQNFAWDERPPQAGADLYQGYFESATIPLCQASCRPVVMGF